MGIFDKYKQNKIKEIEINGEKVKIRKLTNKEAGEIQKIMLKDASSKDIENGEVKISIGAMREIQLKTVAYALVEPKISLKELEELSEDSYELIQKIYEEIQEWDKPKK